MSTTKPKDGVYRSDAWCYAIKNMVKISITVRSLVMCPDWKKCKYHGNYNCKEKQLHLQVIERLKEKKMEKQKSFEVLKETISKEVKK